jgi:hypothetical protein
MAGAGNPAKRPCGAASETHVALVDAADGTKARPPNHPAASGPIPIALPAIHAVAGRRERLGMDTGAGPGDTPADPENDSSANATSRAVWKRSEGVFSRQ